MVVTGVIKRGEVVEKGNGFTRVYHLQSVEPELRTHEKHTKDAHQAVDSGTCIHGIKGPSPLMMLTFLTWLLGLHMITCMAYY